MLHKFLLLLKASTIVLPEIFILGVKPLLILEILQMTEIDRGLLPLAGRRPFEDPLLRDFIVRRLLQRICLALKNPARSDGWGHRILDLLSVTIHLVCLRLVLRFYDSAP